MDTVQKLFRFLDESPTCYHAAANAKAALTAAEAVELRESEQWKLEKGTLYVVERGDSALVAFRVPEGPFHGFLMAAAAFHASLSRPQPWAIRSSTSVRKVESAP